MTESSPSRTSDSGAYGHLFGADAARQMLDGNTGYGRSDPTRGSLYEKSLIAKVTETLQGYDGHARAAGSYQMFLSGESNATTPPAGQGHIHAKRIFGGFGQS